MAALRQQTEIDVLRRFQQAIKSAASSEELRRLLP
jgi:hypothetical protein